MNGSKTFSKIDIGETIVLRGSKFPFNFEYWKYVLNVRNFDLNGKWSNRQGQILAGNCGHVM